LPEVGWVRCGFTAILFFAPLLVLVIISYFAFNKGAFDKWAKFHREKLNRFLAIMFIVLFSCLVVFYLVDHVYFPKPPEDQLVVAISPFYYTDETGKDGADINTADDFEEMIRAEKYLEIKVIRLDNPIRDEEDAKIQGKKVGAHLVIYGETKKQNRGDRRDKMPYSPTIKFRDNSFKDIFIRGHD